MQSRIQRSRISRSKRQYRPTETRPSGVDAWLKWGALPLTAVTVLLTLLGYGYDFGYLEAFGLRPEQLQRSPLDFLLRSYKALVVWVGMSVWDLEYQWSLFNDHVMSRFWFVMGVAVAMFLVLRLAMSIYWRTKAGVLLVTAKNSLSSAWKAAMSSPRVGPRVLGYGFPALWLAFVILTPLLLSIVVWLAGQFVFLAAALIPVGPAQHAKRDAIREVIEPLKCATGLPNTIAGAAGAKCVRVVKDGCEIVRGRYIEQSAQRVWILQKHPWRVQSIPLDGAMLESVADEAQPGPCATASSK